MYNNIYVDFLKSVPSALFCLAPETQTLSSAFSLLGTPWRSSDHRARYRDVEKGTAPRTPKCQGAEEGRVRVKAVCGVTGTPRGH